MKETDTECEKILAQEDIEFEDEEVYTDYEITNYPIFFTLAECARKYSKDSGVFVVPDFQRHPVWSDQKKAKLIESFLLGLPVPPIFLYTEKGISFKIIDGLQRVHTIYSFFNNEFKLIGLNKRCPYLNKKFYELTDDYKQKLENSILPATIIKQTNPIDDSSVYLIFERLNTGGEKLNNMEVRRCIGYGALLKTLEQINLDHNWRKIIGTDEPHNRFLDLELVLRVFALYEAEYTSPMKAFLNEYMEKNKEDTKNEIAEKFQQAIAIIYQQLGEKPFTLKGNKPNYSVLDSVIVSVMKNLQMSNLKDKFFELLSDYEFKAIYEAGQGTMSTKAVKDRLNVAGRILQ